MNASVIVCTYNRCESLAETLLALAAQQVAPGFAWDLVVVNNNSSDCTEDVVRRFAQAHPALPLTYVVELSQGLSNARNCGIRHARGEFLTFTDDDVLPAADWLQTLVTAMSRHGCLAAGGYIAPIWQGPKPDWLTERFYGFLALRIEEGEPRRLSEPADMPFGANMAFHRSVFDQLGVFDPALGRNGSALAGGEEIDLMLRVVNAGNIVMYFPAARVNHKVEAFRLRKSYFRRWRHDGSFSAALKNPPIGGRQLAGVPLYLLWQLARATWQTAVMTLTQPPDVAFRQEMIIWHFIGLIRGCAVASRVRD